MTSYFRDKFSSSTNKAKIASYDPHNEKYMVSSNDQVIYNPLSKIDCENIIGKQNFSGVLYAEIDFGLSTGNAGVSIVSNNGSNVKVTLEWNGVSYVKETATADSIVFDKSLKIPRTAKMTIEATDADFDVSGSCVVLRQFSIISIVKGLEADNGKTIDNKYKWIHGDYSSAFKHFDTVFSTGVSEFNKEIGGEGTGFIPLDNSKVIMESFNRYSDTGSFGAGDSLSYLVSNTEYIEAQADTVIAAATALIITASENASGEIINRGQFTLTRPTEEQYLYLIWNYTGV